MHVFLRKRASDILFDVSNHIDRTSRDIAPASKLCDDVCGGIEPVRAALDAGNAPGAARLAVQVWPGLRREVAHVALDHLSDRRVNQVFEQVAPYMDLRFEFDRDSSLADVVRYFRAYAWYASDRWSLVRLFRVEAAYRRIRELTEDGYDGASCIYYPEKREDE